MELSESEVRHIAMSVVDELRYELRREIEDLTFRVNHLRDELYSLEQSVLSMEGRIDVR